MHNNRTRASVKVRILTGAVCASLVGLVLAASAGAKVVNVYVYNGAYPSGSFNGSDAVGASAFSEPSNIDIDQVSGDVYVGANGYVYHLSEAGTSQAFSSVAPNTVFGQETFGLSSLKVDNSGVSTQGRIYAKSEYSNLSGYLPSGAGIGTGFPIENLGDGCGLDIAPDGGIWVSNYADGAHRYSSSGTSSNEMIASAQTCGFAIDSQENFYIPRYGTHIIRKYSRSGELLDEKWAGAEIGGENLAVDRSNDHVFVVRGDRVNELDSNGTLIDQFGFADGSKSYPGLSGAESIAVNRTTHEVYVGNTYGSGKVDTFVPTGPITIPSVTTEAPSVTPTTATLKGIVDPDAANGGTAVTGCQFEWGSSVEYDHIVPCEEAMPVNAQTQVEATITGLTPTAIYHFRVSAHNANDVQSKGEDRTFQPSDPPEISNEAASEVFSDGARMNASIDASGSMTGYRFEWGTAPCSANPCNKAPTPDGALKYPVGVQPVTQAVTGLTPGATYYWRVIAVNSNSTVESDDLKFNTFPLDPPVKDTCENALVRKQTRAGSLVNCRAYELVSASSTGGYDVESSLIPDQRPLPGFPEASDPPRALYTIHYGAIPGIGDPPNFGNDPYVATRTATGWVTEYVGLPVSGTPDPDVFASAVIGADAGLSAFAFGGPDICSPCFAGGSAGIPVRKANGELVQGMQGSLPVANPTPAGEVRKPLSADGTHLIFGSTQQFEQAGNAGSLSIYDRNLQTGATQVASTMPDGSTMTGEVSELDVSSDGSHILIGRVVGTDGAGNDRYDLYMHVGGDSSSVEIADTPNGVIYDGMTRNGSTVYFTTDDALAGDGDSSADLYRADVTSGAASVSRVSTGSGGAGNTDACTPTDDWNVVEGGPDCGVLGISGGGAVAADTGAVFFLSPERLAGPTEGTPGEPNLYVAAPGEAPQYVTTLAVDDALVVHAAGDAATRHTEDFQLTGNGKFAAVSSIRPITGYPTNGYHEVYRYEVDSKNLTCASCASTGARAEDDAILPAGGGAISDDGRVFFTTGEPLNLRDLNGGETDVYQSSVDGPKLISLGTSEFDSALLSVSADGKDVLFFTHDVLVPQDENGNLVKIYDAREDGGFYTPQTLPPCRASDECHGPGTQSPPPPDIGTYKGVGGQLAPVAPTKKRPCKRKHVRRHGRCVKKSDHNRRAKQRRGARG